MKKISFIFLLLMISLGVFAQATWQADPMHSNLGFTVTHLGIAEVPGHFDEFDVTIISSKPDFSDAVVEMPAQTNSINTRVEQRDNHLRSADFFDAEEYPTLNFKSTAIKEVGKNKYNLAVA